MPKTGRRPASAQPGTSEADTAQATKRRRAASSAAPTVQRTSDELFGASSSLEPTLAEEEAAKLKETIEAIAEDMLCPITQSLLLDPVTAEDGHIYERHSIRAWLGRAQPPRSPLTHEAMGPRLMTCFHARTTIERLVQSGALSADATAEWRAHRAEEATVERVRRAAAAGDAVAAGTLACFFLFGACGVPVDETKWFEWASRAAQRGGEPITSHLYNKLAPPNALLKQADLNEKMRAILIDWLVEVCDEWQLEGEVFFLAVNYLDRYLALKPTVRSRLQLAGVTCLLVACRHREVADLPALDRIVYI